MPRLRLVLAITFLEHVATVLIERGVYFYTHERLGFSDVENLLLALGFGAVYVAGALSSHCLAAVFGERRLLAVVIVAQIAAHLALFAWAAPAMLVAGALAVALLSGLKWPIVESYVSAGRTPAENLRAVGRFNITWSGTIPPTLVLAGLLLGAWPRSLFLAAAGFNVAAIGLLAWLLPRPAHLPHDHPERIAGAQLDRWRALLASARWSMVTSYSLMWVLAALMPTIFAAIGYGVRWGAALSGILDLTRFLAFLALQLWPKWHGRTLPLVLVVGALPLGFFLVLFGGGLGTVLTGEVLFGAAAGMTYYAALYYALVVKNASVDAGGAHEGLIGAGFVIGPASGLLGRGLAPAVGSQVAGRLLGLGPLVLVCSVGAVRALARGRPRP